MIDTLKALFIEQIKDLYHAEKQLDEAMPRLFEAATSEELKRKLKEHHTETHEHASRLERVFELVGEKPAERKCRAMQGLIAETDELLGEDMTPEVRDAAIIAAAQRMEHYEMAGYGTARTYARTLDQDEAGQLLQKTLDEEGNADHALTELATENVNAQAART